MNIRFENTVEDAVAWNQYWVLHTPREQRHLHYGRIVAGLCGVMFGAFSMSTLVYPGYNAHYQLSANIVILLSALLSGFGAYRLQELRDMPALRARTKRLMKTGDARRFLGPQSVTLTPTGISIAWNDGDSLLNWSAVKRVVCTDTHIFLFSSDKPDAALSGIPFRAFTDSAQMQEFLASIEQYRNGTQNRSWYQDHYAVEALSSPFVGLGR